MTRKSLLSLICLSMLCGCNRSPDAPYPEWAEPDPEYRARKNSGNGFDGYVLAANVAIQGAPKEAERVSFTQGAKLSGLKKLSRALGLAEKASRLPCSYQYTIQDPFKPDVNSKGWRLLGRGMVWKIETALESEDFGSAANWVVTATKFGLDLTQGDSQTATLGFSICNDARRAFAAQYQRLSAQQLSNLYLRLSRILSNYPGLERTVQNEKKRMLLGVQFVQDCHRRKSYDILEQQFGKHARPAISYLRSVDDSKRPSYFVGLSTATERFVDHWRSQIDEPFTERSAWVAGPESGVWKRFGEAFWGTLEPMASIADSCLAHTRILALSAWALARSKAYGVPAPNLKGLSKSVTLDPYTGNFLIYLVSGPDFKLYAVGTDGKDDLGESDESGQSPDVVLEFSNL